MKRLKIAHIAPLPSRTSGKVGGVGTYMHFLLSVLHSPMLDHTVICNEDANLDFLTVDGDPLARTLPAWRFNSLSWPLNAIEAAKGVCPAIVHVQHELFLYGSGAMAVIFPLFLRRLSSRYPTVVTVHGVISGSEIDASLMRGRNSPVPLAVVRRLITWIFSTIARSNTIKVVHSKELRERMLALGAAPESVHVISHPLPTLPGRAAALSRSDARRLLRLPEDVPIILTWGYSNSYKGHDELVGGFSKFHTAFPSARLLLGIGPHPQLTGSAVYMRQYNETVGRYSAVAGVQSMGFIAEDVLPIYVKAADVAIFAYTKYLAASGPISLALAAGTPILVSDVFQEAPEAVRFSPTAAGVCDVLLRFFQEPSSISAAGRAYAATATRERIAEQYSELYFSALD